MEIFTSLFDLVGLAKKSQIFVGSSFRWFEYNGDCLSGFGIDMSHSWNESEIIIDNPLKLHCFFRVVFDWKVNTFLLVYYTISKVDLILLL